MGHYLWGVPREVSSYVPRERISDMLDDAYSTALTVVEGSAVFDATQIVADWCRRNEASGDLAVVWMAFSSEPFKLACRALFDSYATWSDSEPKSVKGNPAEQARLLLRRLRTFAGSINRNLAVVLEETGPSDERDALVASFLQEASPFVHIIMIAPERPPLPFVLHQALGDWAVVARSDLALTKNESLHYLARLGSERLEQSDYEQVDRLAQGWLPALRLANLAISQAPNARRTLRDMEAGTDGTVRNYLEQALETIGQGQAQAALRASLLGPFAPEQFRFACGDGIAPLSRKTKDILCIRTTRSGRIKMVPLMENCLRAMALADASIDADAIARRSVSWLVGNGKQIQAIRLCLDLDRIDLFEEKAAEGAFPSLASIIQAAFQHNILNRKQLQAASASRNAFLQTLSACVYLCQDNPTHAASLLRQALWTIHDAPSEGFNGILDEQNTVDWIRMLSILAQGQQGDIDDDLTTIKRIGEQFDSDDPALLMWEMKCKGVVYSRGTETTRALDYFDAAARIAEKERNGLVALLSSYQAMRIQVDMGNLPRAEAMLNYAVKRTQGLSAKSPSTGLIESGRARIALLRGNTDEARRLCREGLERLSSGSNTEFLIDALLTDTFRNLVEGNAEAALETAVSGIDLARERGCTHSTMTAEAAQAIALAACDENSRALQWAERIAAAEPPSDFAAWKECLLTAAWEFERNGRRDEARKLLDYLQPRLRKGRFELAMLSAELVEACLAMDDDAKEALRHTRNAIELAAPNGIVLPFQLRKRELASLLSRPELTDCLAGSMNAVRNLAFLEKLGCATDVGRRGSAKAAVQEERAPLTSREAEVMQHLIDQRTYAEIAQLMGISKNTVHAHANHVYAKTATANRRELIAYAAKFDKKLR